MFVNDILHIAVILLDCSQISIKNQHCIVKRKGFFGKRSLQILNNLDLDAFMSFSRFVLFV
jgi:hypothetical protein